MILFITLKKKLTRQFLKLFLNLKKKYHICFRIEKEMNIILNIWWWQTLLVPKGM